MFHTFTGCDAVSSFGGKGKKTAWDTWMTLDVTRAFCAFAATPDPTDDWMGPLEKFVVLLYDHTSSQESVNQARKQLFPQKGRTIDPIQAALIQHTKRTDHAWGQMMVASPELPSLGDWGGRGRKQVDGKFTGPHYQKRPRPVVNSAVVAKKGCSGHCKCANTALQCTALCHCGGLCFQK